MNLAEHKVRRDGQPIHLGPTECRLLLTLMERPGRVLSRAQLLDLVWGRDVHITDRTVDVHIRRLRKALDRASPADMYRARRGYALDTKR